MAAVDVLGMIPGRTNYSKDAQGKRTAWWTATGGAVASVATRFYSGAESIRFTASGSIAVDAVMLATPAWNGVAPNDAIPVVPDDVLSVIERVSTDLVGKSVYLRIRFYQTGGTEITAGGPWVGETTVLAAGADVWNVLSVHDVIAPALAAFAVVELRAGTTFANTDVLYVDGQDIAKNEPIDTFISGDLGELFGWNGAADESTSYRLPDEPLGLVGIGGQMIVSTRVYRSDIFGNEYDDLTDYVIGGEIGHDIDRDFAGGCSIDVTDVTAFAEYSWIKIYRDIQNETEPDSSEVVGLFRIGQPSALWPEGSGTIPGEDATVQLEDTRTTSTRNLAGSTAYTTLIAQLLDEAGFAGRYDIPAALGTSPVEGLTYLRGTSFLFMINDMLNKISYYRLTTTPDGRFISMPYIDRSLAEPAFVWTIGQDARIIGEVTETRNDDDVFNYVIVTKVNEDKSVTVKRAENKNPAHRYSTVALGLLADPTGNTKVYKTKEIAFDDAADPDALQARADETLALASMLKYVTVEVLPEPGHRPHEIAEFAAPDAMGDALNDKYLINSMSFGLVGSDGTITIKAKRIESVAS